MIMIAGHVYVNPDELEAFVSEARATIPLARATDGCLFFSCAIDDPKEGSMIMLERWRDQEALSAYLAAPHVQALFAKWGSKMRNEVRKYDASNERAPLGV
ncbi:putative quinol monooxygenase [Shouchella clausii]|uniref:Antibiotic biosynthesis monooxygenase n=2 Tax=Bacillales TaxID=1385 RepID=A0ABW9T4K1_9BACL|nr:putative quinol monooxygenase [Paenibacillus campinasensis]MUG68024.1 antibiotic biosynthesis monooxygenase [Paenibacillus campinasensis]